MGYCLLIRCIYYRCSHTSFQYETTLLEDLFECSLRVFLRRQEGEWSRFELRNESTRFKSWLTTLANSVIFLSISMLDDSYPGNSRITTSFSQAEPEFAPRTQETVADS